MKKTEEEENNTENMENVEEANEKVEEKVEFGTTDEKQLVLIFIN
jgi:hypothetical protein